MVSVLNPTASGQGLNYGSVTLCHVLGQDSASPHPGV